MAYAIDIQKRRIMKLNKTSLLSAGALIASLSFYAGTITTPAGASENASVQQWAKTYVSVSKSFITYYTALEVAMSSNDTPGTARVCGKLQTLSYQFNTATIPNDPVLKPLNTQINNTLSSLAAQCFTLVSSPTNTNATKLGGLITKFSNFSNPVVARLKQLTK